MKNLKQIFFITIALLLVLIALPKLLNLIILLGHGVIRLFLKLVMGLFFRQMGA